MIYAVGDIHGRADLLGRLLGEIREDALASIGAARPVLVFVGDYVDRGPSSRAVLDLVIGARREAVFEVRALKGNHEAALRAFLADAATGPAWCEFGGGATLSSYGVPPPGPADDARRWRAARDAFAAVLPREHRDYQSGLDLTATYGGYVFVHAGLRPGIALDQQSEDDLLGIRDDFLAADGAFEGVIVHGHTPVERASANADRINLDTGAYATGRLTAVRLAGDERRFLQAGADAGVAESVEGPPSSARAPGRLSKSGLNIATLILSAAMAAALAVFAARGGLDAAWPHTPSAAGQAERAAMPSPAPGRVASSPTER